MAKRQKFGTPVKATVGALPKGTPDLPKLKGESEKMDAPFSVQMEANDLTVLQLAQERVANAQLHLQFRQRELDDVLAQVRAKYEQGGWVLKTIDPVTGTLTRTKA